MCDTLLAPPPATAEHSMLFGKNSDRQRNEAQAVEYFPRAEHERGAQLKCTYIAIPQVRRTHAVLLSRPFWIWGAEMGANEHGVVIGNEGLTAKGAAPEEKALVGMDLLRLALERGSTAAQALDVLTTLLGRHGQGGNCGHLTPSYYHNGYIIADSTEAFVLETVGREWVVEQVRGVRALSNTYSIGRDALRVSAGLRTLIRDSGWSTEAEPSYAEAVVAPNREHLGFAGARAACSTALMSARKGRLTAADLMKVLRNHGHGEHYHLEWNADCALKIRTVCMHAGAEDRPGQTVGSMVSELRPGNAVHWITGTAAPCTSIFKPVLMDVPLPPHGPSPTDRSDTNTLWWRHERLHRTAVRSGLGRFLEDIREERDALEADFQARIEAVLQGGNAAERAATVARCWKEADKMEERWCARLCVAAVSQDTPYLSEWAKMNRVAGCKMD